MADRLHETIDYPLTVNQQSHCLFQTKTSASWSLEKRRHNSEFTRPMRLGTALMAVIRLFMSGKLKIKGDIMKGKSTEAILAVK